LNLVAQCKKAKIKIFTLLSLSTTFFYRRMACQKKLNTVNLNPNRKRSGGLRTQQAGRGSCRGS
jgi:hypothetical protein